MKEDIAFVAIFGAVTWSISKLVEMCRARNPDGSFRYPFDDAEACGVLIASFIVTGIIWYFID